MFPAQTTKEQVTERLFSEGALHAGRHHGLARPSARAWAPAPSTGVGAGTEHGVGVVRFRRQLEEVAEEGLASRTETSIAHIVNAPQNGAAGSAPRHLTPCACHCAAVQRALQHVRRARDGFAPPVPRQVRHRGSRLAALPRSERMGHGAL